MALSGSGWRRLRVWMRNVDRKEAKSAAWIVEVVSGAAYCSDCSGRAYEDEDDIEEILAFPFAVVVFDGSEFEVVLPGRFLLVPWIWKTVRFVHSWPGKLAQRWFGYRKE